VGSTGLAELAIKDPDEPRPLPGSAPTVMAGASELLSVLHLKGNAVLASPGGSRPATSGRLAAFDGLPAAAEDAAQAELVDQIWHGITQVELRADSPYYLNSRTFKDRLLRVKGQPCEACWLRADCPGVWEPYVVTYGWDDLVPVKKTAD
jgi:hypothetical protein